MNDSTDELSQKVVESDTFEALGNLPDDYADAAIVDYPWQFSIKNGTGRFNYVNKIFPQGSEGENVRNPDAEDAMFKMESDGRVSELLDLLADVLVDGAWLIMHADDRFQDVVRSDLQSHDDWIFRRNWAWTPGSMGMGYYGRVSHYPLPVATLGETDRKVKSRPTLYQVKEGRNTDYDTGKPVELYRKLLAPPVVREGETVLEPFCGSGPGAAVANERGLGYWGCDVDPEAVEKTKDRFKQQALGQMQLVGDSL